MSLTTQESRDTTYGIPALFPTFETTPYRRRQLIATTHDLCSSWLHHLLTADERYDLSQYIRSPRQAYGPLALAILCTSDSEVDLDALEMRTQREHFPSCDLTIPLLPIEA